MLVHVLLKNLALHDYQKYIISSGILMLRVSYFFQDRLLNAKCMTKRRFSWRYMFGKVC